MAIQSGYTYPWLNKYITYFYAKLQFYGSIIKNIKVIKYFILYYIYINIFFDIRIFVNYNNIILKSKQ